MKKKLQLIGFLFLCTQFVGKASIMLYPTDSTELSPSPVLSEAGIVGGFSLKSLFEESEAFSIGTTVWQLGSGFKSDVNNKESDLNMVVPPLSIVYEKAYFKNIGIGMRVGYRMWNRKKLDYRYHYFTLGLRGSYHFNIHPKIDPYIGFGVVGRLLHNGGNLLVSNETKVTADIFTGCRYYLTERIGVFVEIGAEGLTHLHGGFAFKF